MKIKLYQDEELLNGTQHRLQQQEVHIWCMRWRNILPFWEKNQSIMSVEEIEKAEKYHFYDDRMRYAAGKLFLECCLCSIWR